MYRVFSIWNTLRWARKRRHNEKHRGWFNVRSLITPVALQHERCKCKSVFRVNRKILHNIRRPNIQPKQWHRRSKLRARVHTMHRCNKTHRTEPELYLTLKKITRLVMLFFFVYSIYSTNEDWKKKYKKKKCKTTPCSFSPSSVALVLWFVCFICGRLGMCGSDFKALSFCKWLIKNFAAHMYI